MAQCDGESITEYIYGCLSTGSDSLSHKLSCYKPRCFNGCKLENTSLCSLSIYTKNNGIIASSNNKQSSKAYLHIAQGNTFSNEDIQTLTSFNPSLEEVFVYVQNEDSAGYSHSITHIISSNDRPFNPRQTPPRLWIKVLIIIIIIALIVTILYIFLSSKYCKNNYFGFSTLINESSIRNASSVR